MHSVDGSTEETIFLDHVMSLQPFFDMRAITHEAAPGLRVTCRMEGEHAWECEDQRNWTAASYKTYYRPLPLPFPYTIDGGSKFNQSVAVTFDGAASDSAADGYSAIAVTLGAGSGKKMPRIGIGAPVDLGRKSLEALDLLQGVGPQLLIAEYRADQNEADLSACQKLATRWRRNWWSKSTLLASAL